MVHSLDLKLVADITESRGAWALIKSFKNYSKWLLSKRRKCLVLSFHVPILKHKVKQQLITMKWLFQLLQETNKQLFPGHMLLFNFVF